MKQRAVSLLIAFLAIFGAAASASAQGDDSLTVLNEGQSLQDRRLEAPKDLNGYFPFQVPKTKAEWQQRSEELRRRILVANGLWPMPEKTPLNAVIHGRTERDGFTVDKVYFESLPGFYVTGLLFRPAGATTPAAFAPVAASTPALADALGRLRDGLAAGSRDLGRPGRDPVFGHGLVQIPQGQAGCASRRASSDPVTSP